jgi:hypothetical protein
MGTARSSVKFLHCGVLIHWSGVERLGLIMGLAQGRNGFGIRRRAYDALLPR